MPFADLSDDELWLAIAQNTEAISAVLHRQLKLDTVGSGAIHPSAKADLIRFANKFERKYREYTAELRRRYPSVKKASINRSTHSKRQQALDL